MKNFGKIFLIIILTIFTTACSNNKYLKEISYSEYEELIENKETFVLEIMRTGCTYCEKLEPKLEQLVEDYEIEVKVINTANLSTDDVDKLYDETGISGTPTIIFYKDGVEETVASRVNGNVTLEKLISKFKASGFIEE